MSGCFSQHCVTNTKLPFKALESPLNSTFCFGLGAQNNEAGQPKSLHCFHSATVYLYYSLQYPLSSLVLTTPVSPTPLSSSMCSLSSHLPYSLSPCDMKHPSQLRKKLKCKTRRLHTFFIVRQSISLSMQGFCSSFHLVKRKEDGGGGRKKIG